MKKRGWLLTVILILLLCGCSDTQQSVTPFTADTLDTLVEAGVFSETLAPLELDIAVILHGLDESNVEEGAALYSSGATCEEAAIFVMVDESTAEAGEQLLQDYLVRQRLANQDYRPAQMPKLDSAIVERRGNTLLLVVSYDNQAAAGVL